MKKIFLILFLSFFLTGCDKKTNQDNLINSNNQENSPTITLKPESTIPPEINENNKIISSESLCLQISKEFVTKVTGIAIERIGSINDSFINACDYYLTNEKNSPYLAIIVNKNLNFEKHKQIAQKNGIVLKTDPNILGNHYIVWADNETRIVNINIFLSENSFLRIDKNVERAIDNEGLIKLAIEVSKKL